MSAEPELGALSETDKVFHEVVTTVMEHWLGIETPINEWRNEANDILAALRERGYVVALSPDGGAVRVAAENILDAIAIWQDANDTHEGIRIYYAGVALKTATDALEAALAASAPTEGTK